MMNTKSLKRVPKIIQKKKRVLDL